MRRTIILTTILAASPIAAEAAPAPSCPVSVTAPASLVRRPGDAATFRVRAVGVGPFEYIWTREGVPLEDGDGVTGSATPSLSLGDAGGRDGRYRCLVTDHGCDVVPVASPPPPRRTRTETTLAPLATATTAIPERGRARAKHRGSRWGSRRGP